jgi:surface antigen
MFLLDMAFMPPNPLLPEPEPEIIEEVIQEEIQLIDPNGCEPAMFWASEHPHYCIPKPSRVVTQVRTQNTPQTIVRGSNKPPAGWFQYGQCTWLVWTKRQVGYWNNASDWLWQAQRDGYATGTTPRAGAIAWRTGHVAFTEKVNGDMMLITEANYDRKGSIRTIWVKVSSYTAFIY